LKSAITQTDHQIYQKKDGDTDTEEGEDGYFSDNK